MFALIVHESLVYSSINFYVCIHLHAHNFEQMKATSST